MPIFYKKRLLYKQLVKKGAVKTRFTAPYFYIGINFPAVIAKNAENYCLSNSSASLFADSASFFMPSDTFVSSYEFKNESDSSVKYPL